MKEYREKFSDVFNIDDLSLNNRLASTYFAETENFLLKLKTFCWKCKKMLKNKLNGIVKPINSIKKCCETHE